MGSIDDYWVVWDKRPSGKAIDYASSFVRELNLMINQLAFSSV